MFVAQSSNHVTLHLDKSQGDACPKVTYNMLKKEMAIKA